MLNLPFITQPPRQVFCNDNIPPPPPKNFLVTISQTGRKSYAALSALALLAALALIIYSAIPQPATASSHWTDYDTDDDGLIDITTIAQLQAIRWDNDGNGAILAGDAANYNMAYPNRQAPPSASATSSRMGCPGVCRGYELRNNLDFATATTSLRNWTPPASGYNYAGIFEGNGHTIANLNVSRNASAGFFRVVALAGIVRNLGLVNPVVSGRTNVGALAGVNQGAIIASYAVGGTSTIGAQGVGDTDIGGLVGENNGKIIASYARVSVSGNAGNNSCFAGGLVGNIAGGGSVIASYGAGATTCASANTINVYPDRAGNPMTSNAQSANITGGLAGLLQGSTSSFTNSYCDNEAAGLTNPCIPLYQDDVNFYRQDFTKPPDYTTAQMQAPTAYTGIYANWNVDLDGDTFPDNPWNFGSTTTYPAMLNPAQRIVDHDPDGDNLINVDTLHKLNAIRHDLNGDGLPAATGSYAAYAAAFPGGHLADTSTPYMGCAAACAGYELTANLDFAADGISVTTTDVYPDWTPIGNDGDGYAATFDGQGHTIARLTIANAAGNSGLFDTIASGGVIRNVGLIDASIANASSSVYAGVLAADNDGGTITASYAGGGAITITGTSTYAGGLIGRNAGVLRAVYATASVSAGATASSTAGGLIGLHSGSVAASYAAGAVSGTGTGAVLGGLIGQASSTAAAATNSYCDTDATGQANCIGAQTDGATATSTGYTTTQLQTPTGYTGIYQNWNIDLDTAGAPMDDP